MEITTKWEKAAMFATKACIRSIARAWQTWIWCGGVSKAISKGAIGAASDENLTEVYRWAYWDNPKSLPRMLVIQKLELPK